MSDPYGGKYATAGDPYLSAAGEAEPPQIAPVYAGYYGSDGPMVWAQERNQQLLQQGKALATAHGVISSDNIRFTLNKAGYNGPDDLNSLASAYQMLQTPSQAVPHPSQTATASASLGGLSLSGGLAGIPKPLLYAGLAFVAYEFLLKGRR